MKNWKRENRKGSTVYRFNDRLITVVRWQGGDVRLILDENPSTGRPWKNTKEAKEWLENLIKANSDEKSNSTS